MEVPLVEAAWFVLRAVEAYHLVDHLVALRTQVVEREVLVAPLLVAAVEGPDHA